MTLRKDRCCFLVMACFWSVGPAWPQKAELRLARYITMPSLVDSNSPGFWREGHFNIFNSTGAPVISSGLDPFRWTGGSTQAVQFNRPDHHSVWIESVWQDTDGTLFAWYHHEPAGLCPNSSLTAPVIGALFSQDGGRSFVDLGIILSSGDPIDCSARNGFFAGGHGDFSVILDREQQYFYFLFGNYGGELSSQGVATARLAFDDRYSPLGAVWKYYQGEWAEPGPGGRVTPVFPAAAAWQQAETDALWGPSVHWNHYLQTYVVLMNRSCCGAGWPQEGIYVSFNSDLNNPAAWKKPERILRGQDVWFGKAWYPQVLGLDANETDTVAGQVARFYLKGVSMWEILFSR